MSQRTNRRQFLQNSGMGAAGFWIAGRQVGYGQEKSPNAQVNIVWEPQWTPERLSAAAKEQLGIEV